MFLYRLTKKDHIALDGAGGLFMSGRWNDKGIRVIYMSGSRSLTILENLVHLSDLTLIPPDMVIIKVLIPDDITMEKLDEKKLTKGWRSNYLETRHIGSKFLNSKKDLLLKVPSVIVPGEYNYLYNPLHPDASRCSINSEDPFIFDSRLIR
jgi:RES domain-containing protein